MSAAVIVLVLCACVVAAELLVRHTRLKLLSAALLVILLGAVVANFGLIPSGSSPERPVPVYDLIFAWLAPLAIFWLLLGVELRRIIEAGLPMLALFCLGSVGTALGAMLGWWLLAGAPALGEFAGAVTGMYVGTYTGGSINFNAVAIHYGVAEQGLIFAGAVVVDNVITTLWMMLSLTMPKLLARGRWAASKPGEGSGDEPAAAPSVPAVDLAARDRELLGPFRLGLMLCLGLAAVAGSEFAAQGLASVGVELPAMLILTLVALVLAQSPPLLARLGLRGDERGPFVGAQALGMFAVYVFLAVVGAHCDLAALWAIGELGIDLSVLAGCAVLVHGLLIYGAALLFRQDPAAAAVASQANIGGGTTALALARGLGREDLAAPGILVGALGTAAGTFLGFWVAAALGAG